MLAFKMPKQTIKCLCYANGIDDLDGHSKTDVQILNTRFIATSVDIFNAFHCFISASVNGILQFER